MLLHRQTDREIYNTTDSTSIFLFCFLFISSLSKILLTDRCNHDLDISHNINNFKLKQNGNFFPLDCRMVSSGEHGLYWIFPSRRKRWRAGGQQIFLLPGLSATSLIPAGSDRRVFYCSVPPVINSTLTRKCGHSCVSTSLDCTKTILLSSLQNYMQSHTVWITLITNTLSQKRFF